MILKIQSTNSKQLNGFLTRPSAYIAQDSMILIVLCIHMNLKFFESWPFNWSKIEPHTHSLDTKHRLAWHRKSNTFVIYIYIPDNVFCVAVVVIAVGVVKRCVISLV